MASLLSGRKQTGDLEKSSAATMADDSAGHNAANLLDTVEANLPAVLLEHKATDWELAGCNARIVSATIFEFSDANC